MTPLPYAAHPYGIVLLPSEAKTADERLAELRDRAYIKQFGIQNVKITSFPGELQKEPIQNQEHLKREFKDGIEAVVDFCSVPFNDGTFITNIFGVYKQQGMLLFPEKKAVSFEYYTELRKQKSWVDVLFDYADVLGGTPPADDTLDIFREIFGEEVERVAVLRYVSEKRKKSLIHKDASEEPSLLSCLGRAILNLGHPQ